MTAHSTSKSDTFQTRVQRLFNPRSIALIGATDKSTWSSSTFGNLINHQFPGEVHLVNRSGGTVHGRNAYPRIADLPASVDLAYVMVPASAILQVVAELSEQGIRDLVILTAGFGEAGHDGRVLSQALSDFAIANDMMILGPNGNGFINAAGSTVPYGLPVAVPLLRGSVGIVLQSGGIASAVLRFAQSRAVGISLLVSMGNELMLSMTDVVRHMINDPATRVVAMFIESIRNPDDFLEVSRAALAAGKPLVVLKVGRSQMGARVALAHTGSLVGDDAVVDVMFRQNGVVRVESLEDLIVTADLLARHAPFTGRSVGFVTASGGACEIVADRAEQEKIEIPEFERETVTRLTNLLPDFASSSNPVDVTGYVLVQPDLLAEALRIVQADPNTDLTVLEYDLPQFGPTLGRPENIEEFALVAEVIASTAKPVVIASDVISEITEYGLSVATRTKFPTVVGGIDHVMTAIAHVADWSEAYSRRHVEVPRAPRRDELDLDFDGAATWSEFKASDFLARNGIPVVPNNLVHDGDSAVRSAESFGYPVVLKLAADVEHKSDIGGVQLNLRDAESVRRSFEQIMLAGHGANADVQGVLVQPMRNGGIELLVGIVSDPTWGHVLAVGFGGVWVEVLADTALRLLPVDRKQVLEALRELRGFALLTGARGSVHADLDAVADVIVSVARLAEAYGSRLESLEINPLVVNGSSVEALDALISWNVK
ncbi:CoA-binding protein [Rhodococcus sp. 06-156-3C]|uniref:acetate--CoA ligase family protein n=1 Tax=Nocardiaceae TaxID=85025 RepID=UPI0006892E97|nr:MULTISPECIES: acetate--CoA ligase family protein [Rhodococcus]OZD18251.1 CoA-binding protein [Rhodococcus sp. 06-156-4C]OZD18849.1 CoA-binding protein [Rhodococcus sp. 06-156-3C]OZD22359.1 CoA-binding protein [Rhodococcus sp. 06-156-4a]OZD33943.1 CoA-binding protein [Rhodococcus sp. 06-156-3b]OZD38680.1 CoA-binding protein [Rhodococcus sp. 06-156-3]